MPWIQQTLIADGVTAEGRVVVPKAILDVIINTHVATIAVGTNGGTGYVVGETFELATGTPIAINGANFHCVGRVTSVSAGVVTGVELLSAGAYPSGAQPTLTNGATQNSSAAGDNALTVTVTMSAATWTQDSSTYTNLTTNFEWLATSTKASNPPTIGMQSQLSGSNDGMRLQIASGYDSGSSWNAQPGSPPTQSFYLAVPNQDPDIYISVTDRRVNVLVSDGTFKQYLTLGLFIPFVDVASNYPFPGIAGGQSTSVRAFNESWGSTVNGGIVNPIDFNASTIGCYQYRDNLSPTWFGISQDNNNGGDVARSQIWPAQDDDARWQLNHAPVPTGSLAPSSEMNPFTDDRHTGSFEDDAAQGWFRTNQSTDGAQGPAPLGVNDQLHFTVQAHIASNQTGNAQLIGIIDGLEAVHGRGLDAFDEIVTEGGQRFLVFNDTNTNDLWRWVAMEKL